MNVVTVTATLHKNAMVLQAYSLNRFLETPCVHWVIIEDDKTSEQEWLNTLTPIYTKHTLKLVYVPMSTQQLDAIGWIRQQVFKFDIARMIDSEFYYILDTKNILIKETNFDNWNVLEGNNTIQFPNAVEFAKWLPWIDLCCDLTNTGPFNSYWSPETPFKAKTTVVNKLLDAVDVKQLFAENTTDSSEFVLYRFFSDASPVGPSGPNGEGNINLSFWSTDQLKTPDQLNEILDNDPAISMLTLHHRCIVDQDIKLHKILDWLITELQFKPRYVNMLKNTLG